MILNENYQSAKDKYGEENVKAAVSKGIPDEYLLAACRFHCEQPFKTFDILGVQFRQWLTYVRKNSNVDVNTLTYNEFDKLIRKSMLFHITPNCLFQDGAWSLGYWNNFKEAHIYPIPNDWCICRSKKDWNKYTKIKGSEFFIINSRDVNVPSIYQHVCIEIERNGEIYYWTRDNQSTNSDFLPDYTKLLPSQIQDIIFQESNRIGSLHSNQDFVCDYQMRTESKTTKYMKQNKKTINETQLRAIVKEAVKNVLNESDTQTLSIRPNFGGAVNTIDALINKAKELRNMLHKISYTDSAEADLSMVHGELDDYLSNFIMVLNHTKQRTKVNANRYLFTFKAFTVL